MSNTVISRYYFRKVSYLPGKQNKHFIGYPTLPPHKIADQSASQEVDLILYDWNKQKAYREGIYVLTLERKEGEAIIIQHEGQELRVSVRHAKGDKIKLDFDGPTDFVILREELNEPK